MKRIESHLNGWLVFIVIITIFLTGCRQEKTVIYVSAASSLQESIGELADLYMAQHPNVEIRLNFAGSNTLQQQIIHGFQADLFLSAHADPYYELVHQGLVEQGEIFARNRIILISSSEAIAELYHIASPGVNLIFAGEGVPIGIYTDIILNRIDQIHPGFKEATLSNVISISDNVRQSLLKVTLYEADATFVYSTDITSETSDALMIIELPDAYQLVGEYYIALLNNTPINQTARDFYQFILSDIGQEVLSNHGFK